MNFIWYLIAAIGSSLPAAVGYNLIFGRGKILYFGAIGMSLIACYTMYPTLLLTGSYTIAIGVGLISCIVAAVFMALLALRLDGDGIGILSIAVHLALLSVVLNWTTFTRGALGIPQIPRMPGLENPALFALAAIVIAALYCGLIWHVNRGRIGRGLACLAENEWHAESLGISKTRVYIIAFIVGSIGPLLANIFYVQYTRLLHPNDLAFGFMIFYVMIVVAGGPGSVRGASISTILIVLLKEILRFLPLPYDLLGPLRLLLFGVILLGATWIRRKELFPMQRNV